MKKSDLTTITKICNTLIERRVRKLEAINLELIKEIKSLYGELDRTKEIVGELLVEQDRSTDALMDQIENRYAINPATINSTNINSTQHDYAELSSDHPTNTNSSPIAQIMDDMQPFNSNELNESVTPQSILDANVTHMGQGSEVLARALDPNRIAKMMEKLAQ